MSQSAALRPAPAVRVGVTGHRPGPRLHEKQARRVGSDIASILARLAEAAGTARDRNQAGFAGAAPRLRLVSALAEGADRIASAVALDAGWALDVVLPFTPQEYRVDFETPASQRAFDDLLSRAASVHCLAMSPEAAHRPRAYEAAGHWMLDNCDILLGVWDGEPGRGRGGTVDIIGEALDRGMPVIHVHAAQATAPALLARDWSAAELKADLTGLLTRPIVPPADRSATEPDRQRR